MRARDVMTKSIVKIARDADCVRAKATMEHHGIHHLLVYDGKKLVGLLSARDLEKVTSRGKAPTVADAMTTEIVKAPADAPLRRLANLIRGHAIGCLVVTDQGRAVGVITTADLLEAMGRGIVVPTARNPRAQLRYRTPHRRKPVPNGVW